MKNTARIGIVLSLLSLGLAGCNDGHSLSVPSAPSSMPLYRLVVLVRTMNTPCLDCIVEITSGPAAGVSATTAQGRATFEIPLPGAVTVRASKDGYRPATTTVTVDNPHITTSTSVTLESERPALDLAGTRVLEVRADAACAQLPAELRVRTYPVSLVRWEPGFRFRAYPVDDIFKDFLMWVGVSVDNAFFIIENWNNEQDGIIEQLPDGSTLRIHLWTYVVPVVNPDAISTAIEGTISYCDASSNCIAVCESKTHQLTLTRR